MMQFEHYPVEVVSLSDLRVVAKPFNGPYDEAVLRMKPVEDDMKAVGMSGQRLVHLLYDDPQTTDIPRRRSLIGFTIPPENEANLMESLQEKGYNPVHVNGAFVKMSTDRDPPTDLGKLQRYLWKDYIPSHNMKPRTGDEDHCVQLYQSLDHGINEVLVPIQSYKDTLVH